MHEIEPRDPRDNTSPMPDGTRRHMVEGLGGSGLWFFPDGTAWLDEGMALYKHDDSYLLTFREDVVWQYTDLPEADESAIQPLVSNRV